MTNKKPYSNNVTNLCKELKKLTTKEFRQKYILESERGYCYIYEDKTRYNCFKDAQEALKKITKEQAHLVEAWGWYNTSCCYKFIEGDNSEWIDIVPVYIDGKVTSNSLINSGWSSWRVHRIYSDYKFKAFYLDINNKKLTKCYSYSSDEIKEKSDTNVFHNKKILQYLSTGYNDIDSIVLDNGSSYANYRRKLADSTKEIFKRVFKDWKSTDRIDEMRYNIRDHRAKTKASENREKRLNEIFVPMIKKFDTETITLDPKIKAQKIKEGYTLNNYNETKTKKQLYRVGDWICLNSKNNCIFYNVVEQKKYNIIKYSNNDYSFGVCNMDYIFDNDFNTIPSCSYVGVYNYTTNKGDKIPFGNYELECAIKCLDANGKEISPLELFEGTIVKDYLFMMKDKLFTYGDMYENKESILCNYQSIYDLGRVPAYVIRMLFLKEEYKTLIEQLYKAGLTGLTRKLLHNQNSFTNKEHNYGTFAECDLEATAIKNIFNMSLDKLRVYDEFIKENKKGENIRIFDRTINLRLVKDFFDEDLKFIDINLFKEYLDFLNTHSHQISNLKTMKTSSHKSPKEFLTFAKKIDDVRTYADYLTLREQYLCLFQGEELERISKAYPILPDKLRKFKYLRTEIVHEWGYDHVRGLYGWHDVIKTPRDQLDQLRNYYTALEPYFNEDKQLIGVMIYMNCKESIFYLHQELQELIAAHRSEVQDKAFTKATERLKTYEYKGKQFSIIAPKTPNDLVEEGRTLNHCVGGFVNAVIKGSENVLFIRRNDMLDTPWYTMAIDPNRNIEQIHSWGNGSLTKEAQANAMLRSGIQSYNKTFDLIPFLKEWAKEKDINLSTIHESYGALCAHY